MSKKKNKTATPNPELPWSWHKSPGWKGQFFRVCRFYERLKNAEDSNDAEDFLYSFFQNCFHLQDWLLEANLVPQKDIEDLFKSHTEMKLCQDICNASKHFKLSRPKQPREFSLAREYVGPNQGWFQGSNRLVVLSDGKRYDACELAYKCMELWKNFLKNHNL